MQNPITLEEERKVWTIKESVKGITYYYNRSTRKSQYEMPECFKITEEDLDHPDWKQYRTAEGRKFYYNALTRKSCWHLPAEVKQWKMKVQEQKRLEREKNGGEEVEEKLSEAEQIKRKFMQMLKQKMIMENTKWDACMKICEDEPAWGLLKIRDKKNYYQEYIANLKKQIQIQKKAKTEANKVLFMKMLREHKNLTSDCKMHKVQYDFITDPRWRLLEGIEKQNAFQEYLDKLAVKQKQEEQKARDRNIENLKILLEKNEVKHDMKWDDFRKQFRGYQCYKNLSPLDRINTFSEYIMEAQKRFQEQDTKAKRLRERMNRMNFRDLIKQKLLSGQISYKTRWRAFLKEFKNEERILNIMDAQQGSSAQQIFQNFMYGIRENHKLFKSEIKSHFKKINFKMNRETQAPQFYQKLNDLPLFTQAKPIYKQYFYEYFKQKINSKYLAKIEKQKEKQRERIAALRKVQKKERKAIFKIFKQIREHTKNKYNISEHIGEIEDGLKEQNLNISHEGIFKYYLAYLQLEGNQNDKKDRSDDSRSSSSDKSLGKSKKKKKEKVLEESVAVPLRIPAALKPNIQGNGNDVEEEGEIKDDEEIESKPKVEEEQAKVNKQQIKEHENDREHLRQRHNSDSSQRSRKKKKRKHRRRNSSSISK